MHERTGGAGTLAGVAADLESSTNEHDLSTVWTVDQSQAAASNNSRDDTPASLAPWSWSQLEQRAQRLEQLLAESLEKLFDVNADMSQLKIQHGARQDKFLRMTAADPANQHVASLETENARLQAKTQRLQDLVQRHGIALSDASLASKPAHISVPMSTTTGTTPVAPADATKTETTQSLHHDKQKLQAQVAALTRQNQGYFDRLGYFDRALDSFSRSSSVVDTSSAMTITLVASGWTTCPCRNL